MEPKHILGFCAMAERIVDLRKYWFEILLNFTALIVIYLVPVISHLLNFPVYFIEPMRILVILAIAHSNKNNAYLLALTLPLFSFLVSAHPSIIKTVLISCELVINVFLYSVLSKSKVNNFFAAVLSISFAKSIYYFIKYFMIKSMFLNGDLISTPVYFQVPLVIFLSYYLYRIGILNQEKN